MYLSVCYLLEDVKFSFISTFHSSLSSSLYFFTNAYVELFPYSNASDELSSLPSSTSTSTEFELVKDPIPAYVIRRSNRLREPPSHLKDYYYYFGLVTLHDPQSYREASTNPSWKQGMSCEL